MNLERLLISILACSLTAWHLVEVYGLGWRLKRGLRLDPDRRIKPFDCVYCLGSWLGLIYFFIPDYSIYAVALFGSGYVASKL